MEGLSDKALVQGQSSITESRSYINPQSLDIIAWAQWVCGQACHAIPAYVILEIFPARESRRNSRDTSQVKVESLSGGIWIKSVALLYNKDSILAWLVSPEFLLENQPTQGLAIMTQGSPCCIPHTCCPIIPLNPAFFCAICWQWHRKLLRSNCWFARFPLVAHLILFSQPAKLNSIFCLGLGLVWTRHWPNQAAYKAQLQLQNCMTYFQAVLRGPNQGIWAVTICHAEMREAVLLKFRFTKNNQSCRSPILLRL